MNFVSRESQCFTETKSRETLRFEGNKSSLFPSGPVIKCLVLSEPFYLFKNGYKLNENDDDDYYYID